MSLVDIMNDPKQIAGADPANLVEQVRTSPDQDVPRSLVNVGNALEEANVAIANDPSLQGSSLHNYVRRTEQSMQLAFQAEQMEIQLAEGSEGMMGTLKDAIAAFRGEISWEAFGQKLMNQFNSSASPEGLQRLKEQAQNYAQQAEHDLQQAEQEGLVNADGKPQIEEDLAANSVRNIDAFNL